MNLDIKKEVSIEYIENTYALATNYLKRNNSLELKHLLSELELIEDECDLEIFEILNGVNDDDDFFTTVGEDSVVEYSVISELDFNTRREFLFK